MVDTESAARLSAPVERFARSVGVFVVHFGATSVTAAALASLAALESAPDGIWVIDNSGNWPDAGDAEGTSQVHAGVWDAASWGGTLRVLRPERNLGYAGAVNLAFCSAMDAGLGHVWVLNNDLMVVPHALASFAAAFEAYPEADIVGSYVASGSECYFGGGGIDWRRGRAWHNFIGRPVAEIEVGGFERTDWINGASMVMPVSAFIRRGGFDEWFFLYREELEWQMRSPHVIAVVVREFLADHAVGGSTGSPMGPLGAAFMARNGLIMASRRPFPERLAWVLEVLVSQVVRPLARRRLPQLAGALWGIFSTRVAPDLVLKRVSKLCRGAW